MELIIADIICACPIAASPPSLPTAFCCCCREQRPYFTHVSTLFFGIGSELRRIEVNHDFVDYGNGTPLVSHE